jgi:hypothetical protein
MVIRILDLQFLTIDDQYYDGRDKVGFAHPAALGPSTRYEGCRAI